MLIYTVLVGFGCLAGVTTVLFGFGGGFVIVPLLYNVSILTYGRESQTGQSAMHIAVATSTCIMIVSSLLATLRHQRAGNLDWKQIRILIGFIGLGAALGAAAAVSIDGQWVRWAFIAYLSVTILDCFFRPGFMAKTSLKPSSPSLTFTALVGICIGLVATFLGVGGSVMTVPLMRRRGFDMTRATAMANPLSLPVALIGTGTYIEISYATNIQLAGWHVGYIDLCAFVALVVGTFLGVRLASPFIGKIPDNLHVYAYMNLLIVVLIAMLWR